MTELPAGKKTAFLWINKDADNITSREHLPAVNSYVQVSRKALLKHDHARSEKPIAARTLFRWRLQKEKIEDEEDSCESKVQDAAESTRWRSMAGDAQRVATARRRHHATTTSREKNQSTSRLSIAISARDVYHPPNAGYSLHAMPNDSSLDPFFRLPAKISSSDKNLLHLYFTTMPTISYGITSSATYCPIRDSSTVSVSTSHIFMHYLLLMTEIYAGEVRSFDNQVSILHRRAYIYAELSKVVANIETTTAEETVAALRGAVAAEDRLENGEVARKHCEALMRFMDMDDRGREGMMRGLGMGAGIQTVMCFVSVGVGAKLFADCDVLDTKLEALVRSLKAMREWRCGMRHDGWEVLETNTISPLRRFLMPAPQDASARERRTSFVMLYIINMMLFDLRHDLEESSRFMSAIVSSVKSGLLPMSTVTAPPMTAIAVLYSLTNCIESYGPRHAAAEGIRRSWDAVEMLELVEMANERWRSSITGLLSEWLTGESVGKEYCMLGEEEMGVLCEEVRAEWLRRSVGR